MMVQQSYLAEDSHMHSHGCKQVVGMVVAHLELHHVVTINAGSFDLLAFPLSLVLQGVVGPRKIVHRPHLRRKQCTGL